MMKKRIIAITLAAVTAVAGLTSCVAVRKEAAKSTSTSVKNEKNEKKEKVTPTFMYFISNDDPELEQEKSVVAELEKEYSGKVKFNTINITENPDELTNFPLVQGNTPMLIMLNTSNDISAMSPKNFDKSKLKELIDAALK